MGVQGPEVGTGGRCTDLCGAGTCPADWGCFGVVDIIEPGSVHDVCVPVAPEDLATRPLLDFAAGYVQRAVDDLPRQGDRAPWTMSMSYAEDARTIRGGDVVDDALTFARVPARAVQAEVAVPA